MTIYKFIFLQVLHVMAKSSFDGNLLQGDNCAPVCMICGHMCTCYRTYSYISQNWVFDQLHKDVRHHGVKGE